MKKTTKYLSNELTKAEEENRYLCCIGLCNILIERTPHETVLWYRLSDALHSVGRFDEAMDALDQAQQYCNESGMAWILSRKGKFLKERGRTDEAIPYFEDAYNAKPNDATNLIFLSSIYFRKSDVKKAEELVRKATRCTVGAIDEAYYLLGCYLLSQNKLDEAELCFDEAVSRDPNYTVAIERKSDIREFRRLLKPKLTVV